MDDATFEDVKKRLASLDADALRERLARNAVLGRQGWLSEPDPAAVEALLRRRAEELARPEEPSDVGLETPRGGRILELVEFRLGQELFGVETAWAAEATLAREITEIPCVPPHVIGCLTLRGRIHSVLDARRLLGLPDAPERRTTGPVIVLRGQDMEFGLLVDEILGVSRLDGSRPLGGESGSATLGRYALGAVTRGAEETTLTILDGAALLGDKGLVWREDVAG